MSLLTKVNQTFRKVFKTRNERVIRSLLPMVEEVSSFEPQLMKLSDDELKAKTDELRNRLADGATLDNLLPEAFAYVRESARRFLRTDTGVPISQNGLPRFLQNLSDRFFYRCHRLLSL